MRAPSATSQPLALRLLRHGVIFWLAALALTVELFVLYSLIPFWGSLVALVVIVAHHHALLLGVAIASLLNSAGLELGRPLMARARWTLLPLAMAVGAAAGSIACVIAFPGVQHQSVVPAAAILGSICGCLVGIWEWGTQRFTARETAATE